MRVEPAGVTFGNLTAPSREQRASLSRSSALRHIPGNAVGCLCVSQMTSEKAPTVSIQTRERWWSSIPDVGWTVVGLAFVAGASGAAFNHFYTGNIDKETKQKYTALVTFGSTLLVRMGHTIWSSWRSSSGTKVPNKQNTIAADTRGEEGSATVARRRRPRRDT